MSSLEVHNFGCRLNIAEGEAIRAAASDQSDLIVINSCAVTAEAERQARQIIRQAAKRRPNARIIVTGCAAQIAPQQFREMPEVLRVVGNADKRTRHSFLGNQSSFPLTDIFSITDVLQPVVSGLDHARAFIEIQNGCDHRCTFCTIPFGRGNSRSVPAGLVIDAIKTALVRGHQEVVLTGVDLTSYGPDLPGSPTLGLLIERILNSVPQLKRLRLSSLDSIEIDDRLIDLLTGDDRLMPHVHLSLQAGDDMILKRMKRRHTRAQSVALVERLKVRRPEIAIGADLIAGFPTETDEMFENSRKLISDCDIVFGHIFPYSPRTQTPAARMPQVERKIIKARAAKLRDTAQAQQKSWLKSLAGTRQNVLIERSGQNGHAGNFANVTLERAAIPGQISACTIIGVDGDRLIGRAL